jgi:thiol reductant ABC exporter CydD subunit
VNKRLFAQDKIAKRWLVGSIALGALGGIIIIVQAIYLARITADAFLGGSSVGALLPPLYLLLTWIILRGLVHVGTEFTSAQMAVHIKAKLRLQLFDKLRELGPTYVRGERSGELLTTIVEGVEQLEIFVAKYVPQLALSIFLPLAVFLLVARVDWITAIVLAFTFPLLILFMILIGVTTRQRTEKQYKLLGLLGGHFLDVMRGLSTLQLFNRSRAQLAIIASISEKHRKATMSTLYLAFLSAFVMELFATLSTAVIAVFLGLRLINGQIDFDHAYLVLLLAPEFYLPIRALGTQFHAGANGTAAAKRIFEILDEVPQGYSSAKGGRRLTGDAGYTVEFDAVTFAYPGSDSAVFTDLSFVIRPGEKVALVGPTGAGKSTILDLVLGYLKPTAGTIRVNGVDLAELDMNEWRMQCGWMAQKPHLFQGTIADNIRLAEPHAGMVEVEWAAERAHADAFIRELPRGYDTQMNETAALSGGQLSRIALARALFKQAPLFFMDEPTAQLDADSEKAILDALRDQMEGRTVLYVAHRPAMIAFADRTLTIGGEV